ncbi:hypothetical protein CEXT_454881 [Caerostris extrusa]|uniref:Uncharacterized protein n=1 Tax=Caerostris extrusa TaxID=172846 RepID=A0AAV4MWS4_CAEEX|nr:hypothetical protein CEXT_454881 [Caerostris extrusa]
MENLRQNSGRRDVVQFWLRDNPTPGTESRSPKSLDRFPKLPHKYSVLAEAGCIYHWQIMLPVGFPLFPAGDLFHGKD